MPTSQPGTPRPGKEHVLVVGCGYVGEVVAESLAFSHRVTGVRRSPAMLHGVAMLAADVEDAAGVASLPTNAEVIVIALSPGGREVERYRSTYLAAPAAILAHQARPPRLVLLTTSTAVYGEDDGGWVDEDDAGTAPTASAAVLLEAEQAVQDMVARGLAEAAVSLRLGGIYGPGRTRLLRQVRDGEATCHPRVWTNRIHRDDAAGAIVHLVRHGGPLPPVLNVVDDEPALQCDVLTWLAEQLGAPAPRVQPTDEQPESRRGGSKRVNNARLRALGWEPRHPDHRQGYASLVAEMRDVASGPR